MLYKQNHPIKKETTHIPSIIKWAEIKKIEFLGVGYLPKYNFAE